jgi:ankyrin
MKTYNSVSKLKSYIIFYSPVIIEVPHFASLRGKEREIIILKSDNGETWKEHILEESEEAVQKVLNECFNGENG